MIRTKNPAEFLSFFREHDKLGALVGAHPVSINQDECTYEYQASPGHYNPNDILHGGALYSAMDSCQGAFVHFILEDIYEGAVTGTSTIKYLRPIKAGKIRIRTWLAAKERRKLFVSTSATDEAGNEVAQLEEIWICLPPKTPGG
jgi:acyl-coenzyme A thioesterase PaaI-like protein